MPLETQVSVMVQNHAGALNEICMVLADAQVNIRSLKTTTDAEWAIVGVVVDHPAEAVSALSKAGFRCGESQVITVAMDNHPGALAGITTRLTNANISIIQTHLAAEGDQALLVLMTTDNKRAVQLVE